MKRKERHSPTATAASGYKSCDLLTTGTVVEVSSDDEGFKGSWYAATILKSPSSRRRPKALVEYRTLVSEFDSSRPLTEYVDVSFIRPPPPATDIGQTYEPHDVVDAFHRDGWWKGVVSQVEISQERSMSRRYLVIFENPPEQFYFHSADLRFHLLWANGSWVRPPKQKRMEGLKFGKGMAVEVNFDKENLQGAWFPAIVLEEVGFNSFLVEYDNSKNDGEDVREKETVDSFHIRPPPPKLEIKNFEILEAVDVFHDSCWKDGMITKILREGRYSVFLKHANEELQFSQSEIRPHLHMMNGAWEIPNRIQCEEQLAHIDNNAKDSEVVVCIESSSTALDHTVEKSSCKKIGNAIDHTKEKYSCKKSSATQDQTEEKFAAKRLRKNPLEQSTPPSATSAQKKTACKSKDAVSSPSKKFRNENSVGECHAKLMPMKSTKQEVQNTLSSLTKCSPYYLGGNLSSAGSNCPWKAKNTDPSQQEAGLNNGKTCSSQKMEVQLNAQVTSQWVPVAVKEDKSKGDPDEIIIEVEHIINDPNSSLLLADRRASLAENSSCVPYEEINMQKESAQAEQQKKGEQHNFAEGSASKIDFKDCASKAAELSTVMGLEYGGVLVETSPIVSSVDHTAKEVNITAVRTSCFSADDGQTLSACFEGNRKGKVENFNSVINVQVDNELVKSQEMPFVKSLSIWEHIESLGVFQFLPQKPHFSPLFKYKETMREGFAIGHMLTFATIVEKASKLLVEDPRNLFDNYLETLTDLETLGFDVKAVADRLNELLSIKNRQERLQNLSKDVQTRIAECDQAKAKLEEDIDTIDKTISELEEKRAMKVSLKVMKDSEITALAMDANDINEGILNIKLDFENLAAAPW